jgi:hypothetical protein
VGSNYSSYYNCNYYNCDYYNCNYYNSNHYNCNYDCNYYNSNYYNCNYYTPAQRNLDVFGGSGVLGSQIIVETNFRQIPEKAAKSSVL